MEKSEGEGKGTGSQSGAGTSWPHAYGMEATGSCGEQHYAPGGEGGTIQKGKGSAMGWAAVQAGKGCEAGLCLGNGTIPGVQGDMVAALHTLLAMVGNARAVEPQGRAWTSPGYGVGKREGAWAPAMAEAERGGPAHSAITGEAWEPCGGAEPPAPGYAQPYAEERAWPDTTWCSAGGQEDGAPGVAWQPRGARDVTGEDKHMWPTSGDGPSDGTRWHAQGGYGYGGKPRWLASSSGEAADGTAADRWPNDSQACGDLKEGSGLE